MLDVVVADEVSRLCAGAHVVVDDGVTAHLEGILLLVYCRETVLRVLE